MPDVESSGEKPDLPHGASAAAFDQVAARYDAESTYVDLSRWIRARVWERLALRFRPGDHVLEIGCGTGEDAIWLARRGIQVTASDASPAMLAETQRKAEEAGLTPLIKTRLLDLADAAAWDLPDGAYQGTYSNYGPLNCIGDWSGLGATLARVVQPGGWLGFGVMGPVCLWEIAWHGLHGHWRTASRRWSGRTIAHVGGIAFPVYYPTPGRLQRDLGSLFRRQVLLGLGVFLPPSDLYVGVGKHRRLTRLLTGLERRTAARWPFPFLADHYWIELQRR